MNYYTIECIILEHGDRLKHKFKLTSENVDKAIKEVHEKARILQTIKIVENGILL